MGVDPANPDFSAAVSLDGRVSNSFREAVKTCFRLNSGFESIVHRIRRRQEMLTRIVSLVRRLRIAHIFGSATCAGYLFAIVPAFGEEGCNAQFTPVSRSEWLFDDLKAFEDVDPPGVCIVRQPLPACLALSRTSCLPQKPMVCRRDARFSISKVCRQFS
jgi:hypothetical protein